MVKSTPCLLFRISTAGREWRSRLLCAGVKAHGEACPSWIPCGPSRGGCGTIIRVPALPISGCRSPAPRARGTGRFARVRKSGLHGPGWPLVRNQSPETSPPTQVRLSGFATTRCSSCVCSRGPRPREGKLTTLRGRRAIEGRTIRPRAIQGLLELPARKMCGSLPACRTVLAGTPRQRGLQVLPKRSTRLSGRRSRRMVSNDEHGRSTLHRKVAVYRRRLTAPACSPPAAGRLSRYTGLDSAMAPVL